MSSGYKATGWDQLDHALDQAIRDLEDDKALAAMGIEAAQPMVSAVASRVGPGSPWKETGHTRDDIHAAWDKNSDPGTVKISVGAGPKNAFKLRFLEFGTSRMPAHPALRPGYDSTIGEVQARIVAGLLRMAKTLVKP